ncbi:hypothetical protein AMECASPLE_039126, partial [Ameca splendens]
ELHTREKMRGNVEFSRTKEIKSSSFGTSTEPQPRRAFISPDVSAHPIKCRYQAKIT